MRWEWAGQRKFLAGPLAQFGHLSALGREHLGYHKSH